jgi:hypothetical protein
MDREGRHRTSPGDESGQAAVEWVGLVLLVSTVLAASLAAGVALPGAAAARTIADRILCAVSVEGHCGEGAALVSAYGEEVAALVRAHAPGLAYENGMRALPVDFRSCREAGCSDGLRQGIVSRSAAGEPVVEFVHVVDCRPGSVRESEALGVDCSGPRRGNLYLQYWTYYADSATLRGVPVAGEAGFHRDDWEGAGIRIGPDGETSERASSHAGYNYEQGLENWGSDTGIGVLRDLSEALGARPGGGWGPETGWLFVSGGSHAGNAKADPREVVRATPSGRILLIPLEPLAEAPGSGFAIVPPWRKRVWRDPEAGGTD